VSTPQPASWKRRLVTQALKGIDRLERQLNPLKTRLQQDPYYRFRSYEELQAAARLGVRIDVNRATVDDWLRLPGLSIHQARTLSTLVQQGVALMSLDDVAAALGLPLARLLPLAPILEFCYYETPAALSQELDLNQASGPQLMQIPGIPPDLVRRLLYDRRLGPYRSWADLQQRLRLTPAQVGWLIHYLRLS